ncbi:MAG: rhodanese-related sulfurtransferase [Chlamydiales bacterium]|nr:rhodanese-related sulfurtransferase [Chlamydiales bacterium]
MTENMTSLSKEYWVLAYYYFTPIENPEDEVRKHKTFFEERDVSGRIYISHQGINGQMSALKEDAYAYMHWMHDDARFKDMEFKVHKHHENAFPKMTVKVRKQLVAMDKDVDLSKRGQPLSAKEWESMLDNRDEDLVLIDTRNNYETRIGYFEGALLPPLETFREFPQFAKELKKTRDPKKTKVLMYCTGGIRCELYSALMMEEGFESVYQLQGGVIKYGLEVGHKHWVGKLFVFDDRLAISVGNEDGSEIIGSCRHCKSLSDTYYNCANMDCNELFLCCLTCLHTHKGCCQESCVHSERLRPYHAEDTHKPFRKKHLYK